MAEEKEHDEPDVVQQARNRIAKAVQQSIDDISDQLEGRVSRVDVDILDASSPGSLESLVGRIRIEIEGHRDRS